MKTVFALLDENGEILRTSDEVSEIINYSKLLKGRRTGKSTRAIFKALGTEYSVYILYRNRSIAQSNFKLASIYLDSLKFEYTGDVMKLMIKPKLSGSIYFTTIEDLNMKKIDYSIEHLVIEDL